MQTVHAEGGFATRLSDGCLHVRELSLRRVRLCKEHWDAPPQVLKWQSQSPPVNPIALWYARDCATSFVKIVMVFLLVR